MVSRQISVVLKLRRHFCGTYSQSSQVLIILRLLQVGSLHNTTFLFVFIDRLASLHPAIPTSQPLPVRLSYSYYNAICIPTAIALFRNQKDFADAQRKGWQQIKGAISHLTDSYFLCYQRAGPSSVSANAETFPIASLKIICVDLNPADIGGLGCAWTSVCVSARGIHIPFCVYMRG